MLICCALYEELKKWNLKPKNNKNIEVRRKVMCLFNHYALESIFLKYFPSTFCLSQCGCLAGLMFFIFNEFVKYLNFSEFDFNRKIHLMDKRWCELENQ